MLTSHLFWTRSLMTDYVIDQNSSVRLADSVTSPRGYTVEEMERVQLVAKMRITTFDCEETLYHLWNTNDYHLTDVGGNALVKVENGSKNVLVWEKV